MLELKKIVKNYYVASETVEALKGVSMNFRKQEFVSILGPSGCGKTTLLNIIGGLDQYTDGDLIINGRSTKNFKDRDWDVYRNHRIGFVFQSYNLIPHQTILGNVELALTISGLSKNERVKKAKEALDKVGLKGQYKKRPNQLSGGQCQRVAIARAIVNDPEILLADEPTGALDTQTSIQIMEIIKEISNERLVIMVTHNPDLANKYSTRIINLLDGEVLSDSNPFDGVEEQVVRSEEAKAKEKAKMSLFTAFRLSTRNLFTKFKRTLMVVIAGSIGIIGVSVVLAVSRGVTDYVNNMQDDLLSGNPIKINESGIDLTGIMSSASTHKKAEALEQGDFINVHSVISILVQNEKSLTELVYNNEVTKDYVNYVKSMPEDYYKEIKLRYNIDLTPNIYTKFNSFDDYPEFSREMSLHAITETYTAMLEKTEYGEYASYITSLASTFQQGLSNMEYVAEQYDLVYGELPKNKEDILVVVDDENGLTDLLLMQLGYVSQEEFINWVYDASPDRLEGDVNQDKLVKKIDYADILNKEFYWFPNDLIYEDQSLQIDEKNYMQVYDYKYERDPSWTVGDEVNQGIKLKICGIVKSKSTVSYGALSSGFLYTEELAREVIRRNINSQIVQNVREHGSVVSMPYTYTRDYIFFKRTSTINLGISYDLAYVYTPEFDVFYLADGSDEEGHDKMKRVYVGANSSGLMNTFMSYISSAGASSSSSAGAAMISGGGSSELLSSLSTMKTMNINNLGGTYVPKAIQIYPNDFDTKYLVTDYLEKWNSDEEVTYYDYKDDLSDFGDPNVTKKTVGSDSEERVNIRYTDEVELVINMMKTMINIVTYSLVVFTSLALVVSTVMIGIITYVSVVERVKEIGVIRSLGGRKRDVSHLFNAETVVIGFSSGIFGILMTLLICTIVNAIVKNASSGTIPRISNLTFKTSLIMIGVSIFLTVISGLIPAFAAARKNPVDALRTE